MAPQWNSRPRSAKKEVCQEGSAFKSVDLPSIKKLGPVSKWMVNAEWLPVIGAVDIPFPD
jgi:hypothetical protein